MDYSEKIRELFVLARKDEKYTKLTKDYLELEDQFGEIASRFQKMRRMFYGDIFALRRR